MADNIKQLRRIVYLLSFLKDDLEWLASDASHERKKKIMNVWREKIVWILRDIMTSTQRAESFNLVFNELNSDRAKSVLEWIDLGIECKNIDEVIAVIRDSAPPAVEEKPLIAWDMMPISIGATAYDLIYPDNIVKDDDAWKWLLIVQCDKNRLPYHVVDYLRSEGIEIENKHEKK